MIRTTLLFLGLTSSMAFGQTTDIFPIRSVSDDRTQIAVELDNESNYDIFCEYIVSPVIYRSAESINNIDDVIYIRNVWVPKQSKRKVFGGLDVTQRLRNGLFSDAKIDVVKNEFISNYTKCSQADLNFNTTSFQGHDDDVIQLEFSPDGLTMASAGHDKKVKLWSAVTGTKIEEFSFPGFFSPEITFDADGRFLLVIPSADSSIYFYDVTTGLLSHKKTIAEDQTSFSKFSPDKRFALVRTDNHLYLTSVITGQTVWLTSAMDISNPELLSFSEDSKKIAFAHETNASTVTAMNIAAFPQLHTIANYYQQIENISPTTHSLSWSKDSQKLLVGKNNSHPNPDTMVVLTFNGASYSTSVTIKGSSGLFLPNGKVGLIDRATDLDAYVKLWIPTSPFAHVLVNSFQSVSAYARLHALEGSILQDQFLTSGNGWIRSFTSSNGTDTGSLYTGSAIYSLKVSQDGKYIFAGLGGGKIAIYDIKSQLLKPSELSKP